MVVDTSVLLHVAFAEPGWDGTVAFLLRQRSLLVSGPSLVEPQAVLAGHSSDRAEEVAFVGSDFQHTDLKTVRFPLG